MADTQERLQRALVDRYQLIRPIGRGGMATVFLADDRKHGRPVAIKVMHPEMVADLGSERFQREIEIVARLSHPHIVPLFDSGTADGLLFYVMPLVEGESLRARLTRERQLPLDEALRLAGEIAAALGYAHRHGLVHRDVKPENVLLSDGLARLADFGIARAQSTATTARTTSGVVLGTVAYMSPEQASGDAELDARSDLYALGCVLYEMLAGQPPFTGPVDMLLHLHRTATPRPVAELRPSVPRHVAAALTRVLAKTRADRHASAAELAAALAGTIATPADRQSVAVLPFLNLSTDPEKEYFADGVTEDVIALLSKVRTLKVISRTSVMPFKKREQSAREIGARLDVATLLDGSVRWVGDRVRIVANLVDVETDESLWSETYDRRVTDIFAIQSDVAINISGALKAELSPGERSRIGREPTSDVEAYRLYLHGRYLLSGLESFQQAVERLREAIARDPDFARAHAALGYIRMEMSEHGDADPAHRDEGRAATRRALELDPELAEAHTMLAYERFVYDFDWAGAEAAFKRALELSPVGDTFALYGRMCAAIGRFDEAVALHQRAQELDPLYHRNELTTALIRAGRLDEALRIARQAVELKPDDPRSQATLGWALIQLGRQDEGLERLHRARMLEPHSTMWIGQYGQATALAGRPEEARAMLDLLADPARPTPASPYHRAWVHLGLGEHDEALDLLERAVAERSGAVYGIKGSFLLSALHGHPRFEALLKQIHLG